MLEKLPNKFGPWVTGKEFFNRVAEVEQLTRLLDEKNNILLIAPRRVGKTSLVRETFLRMTNRGQDYLVFADIQDCKTPEDVIVALSLAAQPHRSLAAKIQDAIPSLLERFRETVEGVGNSLLELRLREAIAGDWQAKGRRIVESLAEADRPIAICLDELPIMLNRLITGPGEATDRRATAEHFLSWLRKTVDAHRERVRWIICGSIGLEPILARHNLSFTAGHLRTFHLWPWDRSTADECLQCLAAHQGHPWPAESRDALLDALGHFIPHHVQMYFGHVMDHCRMRSLPAPTAEDVHRVWETRMLSTRGHAELADYEERLLRVLEESLVGLALDLLTEAAVVGRLTTEAAQKILERHSLDRPRRALRDVLGVLEHDGYLEMARDSSDWVFVSPLIRAWWSHRFRASHLPV